MARARTIEVAADLPAPALALLEASAPAAWLIDVTGGRLLAANAAGGALLGFDGEKNAPPLALDAAMPALARLRALAAGTSGEQAGSERLVLWTRKGAVRVRCRVEIHRAAPPILAVVVAVAPGADAGASPAAAPRQAPSTVPPSLRASLAHELKTPVSAIAAAAEVMKDERFGPLGTVRYLGYASDIHGSAQHVLGVIDRMLADAGADTDPALQPDLDFAEIDAGDVLRAAVSQLAPLAERAGISLALELAPRLPHLVADATSLRQIVFNLLTNALKFTGRGGQVTVAARYDGGGPLTIAVSDTGTGMAHGEVERLLAAGRVRPPQRRDGSASTGGLGLGLPLVQALARANGAELILESTPGKGTSACVVFGKDRVIPV